MMNKALIALIYQNFINYDKLTELIVNTMMRTNNPYCNMIFNTNRLDIYIDVQSVFKKVLKEELLSSDLKTMSIAILNIAGHYRHFFKSRFHKSTRVFIINSTNVDNGNIYTDANYSNPDMFKIVRNLVPYFKDTYYIESPIYNASTIILALISSQSLREGYPVAVISNAVYSYQIPAYVNTTFVIRTFSQKIVYYNNVFESIYPKSKIAKSISDINPGLLPVIMGLYKCPELDMPMQNAFKSTISIIRNFIMDRIIRNGYNSPVVLEKIFPDAIDRIRKCDLMEQCKMYMNSMEFNCVNSWKIYKPVESTILANELDKLCNANSTDIDCLNYLFLSDI